MSLLSDPLELCIKMNVASSFKFIQDVCVEKLYVYLLMYTDFSLCRKGICILINLYRYLFLEMLRTCHFL